MKVLLTIPAYNEEKTIGKVIKNIKNVMNKKKYKYEIVVVDDGSLDKTPQIAKREGVKVYSHPRNYGLAETFRTEIKLALKSKADIIVHIDADGQYVAEEIPKLIEPIEKKEADLVLGSRFLGQIEEMPLIKKLGNKIFSKIVSKFAGIKITDAQTGFRVFSKEVAEIPIISTHTYTQEQIIKASKSKFRIIEIPIQFNRRSDGKSRLMKNPFQYGINALITIIRIYRDYRPLTFFGSIGSILFSIGVVTGVYFIYLHFTTGIKGHLGLLFLMLTFLFTGLQIILFGFLADMLRKI